MLGLLLTASVQVAVAQQPDVNAPPPPGPLPVATASGPARTATPAEEQRYRIGPGDLLDIRVFNRPQLSRDGVRVDGKGKIRMPLIEGEIQAACRSESELAKEIATRYLKYQRHPQVDVFIKDFQSKLVAVIGAVNAPGRFQLQRRVRLLELLTFAGGPALRSGRSIQIIHTGPPSICEEPAGETTPPDESDGGPAESLSSYNLNETLRGTDKSNPYVRPGDIITLPEAEQVFVVGNVLRPLSIPLKEPITISQAIAMAGGTLPDTKSEHVRIERQAPGGKTEIYVDLKSIEKHRAEDIALQANDIVHVPTASGKSILRSLVGAVVPTVAQLPVRVIP